MDAAFYSRTELTAEEAAEQDAVLGALTAATRALADAQLRTELLVQDLEHQAIEVAGRRGDLQPVERRVVEDGTDLQTLHLEVQADVPVAVWLVVAGELATGLLDHARAA